MVGWEALPGVLQGPSQLPPLPTGLCLMDLHEELLMAHPVTLLPYSAVQWLAGALAGTQQRSHGGEKSEALMHCTYLQE